MASRLLGLWVWIPPGAWIFVYCECCVLSGRGLCDRLIAHPEESYQLWCIIVCDLETSWMRRPLPTGGCCAKIHTHIYISLYLVITYIAIFKKIYIYLQVFFMSRLPLSLPQLLHLLNCWHIFQRSTFKNQIMVIKVIQSVDFIQLTVDPDQRLILHKFI